MLRLDFLNKTYSLEEIINAYTDGDINNFKGDEDFLTFIISYSLGKHLVGPDASKYEGYKDYDGLLNIMRLDEYGYFGKKVYQIYEICGKDKMKFMETCDLIGEYSIKHTLEKETIDTNLKLKNPVSFIDSIILSTGKKPIYNPKEKYNEYDLDRKLGEEEEFNHEVERSLRHRINESIKENGDDIELLEELPSYVEKERREKEEQEAKRVKDDYEINVKNLYFGTEHYDISGGLLGMKMTIVSWFEYMNMEIMNYHVFRSVPLGDFCLIDNDGKIHIPDEVLAKDNVKVTSNTPIRGVRIGSVENIIKQAIKNEEENYDNEETLLRLNGLLEHFENKGTIKVSELSTYEPTIRNIYEQSFGNIFNSDNNDKSYEPMDDNPNKKM